jgi:hypothetical protein
MSVLDAMCWTSTPFSGCDSLVYSMLAMLA